MSRNETSRKPYTRPDAKPKADDAGSWLHDKAPSGPRKRGPAPRLAPSGASASAPGQQTRLQISNLHYEIMPKDLTAIFGQIGTLVKLPEIKYDRSGRSSGIAIVTFETPAEATRAKNQFNGVLAKGQPMEIAYDVSVPRQPRRVVSEPSSLLNRVQKAPLSERLSRDDIATGKRSAAAKAAAPATTNGGPVRNGRARGGGRGAKAAKVPKKVMTAEDLDKELDAFMVDDPVAEQNAAPVSVTADAQPAAAVAAGDVEMV